MLDLLCLSPWSLPQVKIDLRGILPENVCQLDPGTRTVFSLADSVAKRKVSRYPTPHQGAAECARRRARLES